MALGGATKKLQNLVDTAEDLYQRINELREEIHALRQTVQDTNASVDRIERDVEEQRAVLFALAREQGVDVDRVVAEAAIREAEPTDAAPEGTADAAEQEPAEGTGDTTGATGDTTGATGDTVEADVSEAAGRAGEPDRESDSTGSTADE